MNIIIVIGFIALIGIALSIYFKVVATQRDHAPDENILLLKEENARLRAEKDEMAGKGKHLYADNVQLKEELKSLQKERDAQHRRIAQFEAEAIQREEKYSRELEKLDSSKRSFEDERQRIRREDEERQQRMLAERDRIWNDHEKNVIGRLQELCKLPEYGFATFDNKNLPAGFDGKLKPDFMIEFLGQYVIFDAKVSRSENLNIYLSKQVKDTPAKLQKNSSIYPTVFFVVPTEAITGVQKLAFYEQGYAFFVISPEALAPILSSLKKISNYEFAQEMDPQERENIVNLIAEFDFHINFRNAADLLLAQSGVGILEKAKGLNPDLRSEISLKKEQIRLSNFQPSDIKRLMLSTESQQTQIDTLVAPQVPVPEKHLSGAARILTSKEGKNLIAK